MKGSPAGSARSSPLAPAATSLDATPTFTRLGRRGGMLRRLTPALAVLLSGAALPLAAQTNSPSSATSAPAIAAAGKLFIVTFTTGPGWDSTKAPTEQAYFREHSANLQRLRRDGILLIGARHGDKGMIVLRAANEAAVQAQLAQDPSLAAGTFVAQVDEFRPFMHGATHYLASAEAAVLRAYYDAFNRHEAEATAAFCAEDLKWYSVEGDKVGADASSRAQLLDWLTGYFKSLPTVRSEVVSLDQAGAFLTVRERASWENKAGQRVAQQALAIYEIRDGLIRRVWYYPSAKDTPPAR